MKIRELAHAAAIAAAALSLASCNNAPDADAIRVAVSKFFETARAGAHYEVGAITNIKCSASKQTPTAQFCSFDMELTDKDSGKATTTHEGAAIDKDGTVIETRPSPWVFEQAAAIDTLLAGPQLAGMGFKFDKVSPSCSFLDGAEYCLASLQGHDGPTAFTANVFGKAALTNGRWTVAVDPPKLEGSWENAHAKLNFSQWGLSLRLIGGNSYQLDTKPNGNTAILIQLPQANSLGGNLVQNAGPISNCVYKLTLIKLSFSACSYEDLLGSFYKTADR